MSSPPTVGDQVGVGRRARDDGSVFLRAVLAGAALGAIVGILWLPLYAYGLDLVYGMSLGEMADQIDWFRPQDFIMPAVIGGLAGIFSAMTGSMGWLMSEARHPGRLVRSSLRAAIGAALPLILVAVPGLYAEPLTAPIPALVAAGLAAVGAPLLGYRGRGGSAAADSAQA